MPYKAIHTVYYYCEYSLLVCFSLDFFLFVTSHFTILHTLFSAYKKPWPKSYTNQPKITEQQKALDGISQARSAAKNKKDVTIQTEKKTPEESF